MSALELLEEAARRGMTLAPKSGRLAVTPARLCTPDFATALREQKHPLMELLRVDFLIVRSAVLNATVFFVRDEPGKKRLISLGAEPGSIYTRDELRLLVEKRITAADILLIHSAKMCFAGTIKP